jgi:hypothetical protein
MKGESNGSSFILFLFASAAAAPGSYLAGKIPALHCHAVPAWYPGDRMKDEECKDESFSSFIPHPSSLSLR